MTNGVPKFTLEIETENLVAWMVINNVFAWKKEEKEKDQVLWNGVLVQLGKYVRWRDEEEMQGFGRIEFYKPDQNVPVGEISRGAFEDPKNCVWINVLAKPTTSLDDPMDKSHLKRLGLTKPCSLDRFFTPYRGGITLWSENGYQLQVTKNEDHLPHKQYTFTIDGPFSIKITGLKDAIDLKDVDRLKICEPVQKQQGGHQSPPQEP